MSRLVQRKKTKSQGRPISSSWRAYAPSLTEMLENCLGRRGFWRWLACIPLALAIVVGWVVAAQAQDEPLTPGDVQAVLDNIWVLVAAILVIFMNAGFGMLETGFCRRKNAVNILSKNLIVFALTTLAFWAFGFSLMFGGGSGFIGSGGFFLSSSEIATYGIDLLNPNLTIPTFFLFQAAFAGTAATIVSGCVAERIRFSSFFIFSLLITGISYPITGHWVWGGGWLSEMGFTDFAGSTIVHSVGGWAGLIGAAFLGPRIGKYQDDRVSAIPGHNLSISTLGCLILWIGWFGFNPGSELAASTAVPYIATTTNLAAAAGGGAATVTSWRVFGKPDLSMIINGILAGLVSITAGCAGVSYGGAIIIGLIAGVIVVFAVRFFDGVKIDDPVGALSVHLVCGIWGTLAVGIFDLEKAGIHQFMVQLLGVGVVGLFTVALSSIFWLILRSTLGLRVTPKEEMAGLDLVEHGMEAYSGFHKDTSDLNGY